MSGTSNKSHQGAVSTRKFYDDRGWARNDEGKFIDQDLFSFKEDGPLRQAGARLATDRVRKVIQSIGVPVRLLECGCGGTPVVALADLCKHFTAVDFSSRGLNEAANALAATGVKFDTQVADICKLQFDSDSFDAVYSAHVLYHIPSAAAQAAALAEMIRVVRPGGAIILTIANPRPFASPLRLLKRLIADTPGISTVARRLHPAPPLPYNPMSISWMRQQFRGLANVDVITGGIVSTWFNQNISERSILGSIAWKSIVGLEREMPHLSAYLGNYVTVIARKNLAGAGE